MSNDNIPKEKIMASWEWRNLPENEDNKMSAEEMMHGYAIYFHHAQQRQIPTDVEKMIEAEYPMLDYQGYPKDTAVSHRNAMHKGYNLAMHQTKGVDWDGLEKEYFKECTMEVGSRQGDILVVSLAPHDLFNWFRTRLQSPPNQH